MPHYEVSNNFLKVLRQDDYPVLPPRNIRHSYQCSYDSLYEEIDSPDKKFSYRCGSKRKTKAKTVCILLILVLIILLCVAAGISFSFKLPLNLWNRLLPRQLPECPPDYKLFDRYCYKVSLSGVTFDEAKQSCESEESHLASIHSLAENDFLLNFYNSSFEERDKRPTQKRNVWIGLVYLDGEWKWTDGTKVDFVNWEVDEPNNLQDQEWWTVMVNEKSDWAPGGNEWNNIYSQIKNAFFCKKLAISSERQKFTSIEGPKTLVATTSTTTVATGTPSVRKCSLGYQLFVETGFCYKLHNLTSKVKFAQANEICQKEKAHLASIHSKEENRLLADLSRKSLDIYPETYLAYRMNEEDEVLIGLIFKNGKWEWSDGTLVDYTNWGLGEPNNLKYEWTATLVTSIITDWNPDGQVWNNIHHSTAQRAFICKNSPV